MRDPKPPATGLSILRAPNHLGDVVMALPGMAADGGDIAVVGGLAPLVRMAGLPGQVLPFDRGPRGWTRMVRDLRARRYRRGVLLTSAFSAAWLFRWGGVRRLRGTATDGRSWLLADPVPTSALRGRHRIDQYRMLLQVGEEDEPRGWSLAPPAERVEAWAGTLGPPSGPLVGLFPGSNAPARRWPPNRFAEVGRSLAEDGARVVVLGGPAEADLTREVSRGVPHAFDAGGATDLVGLSAVLSLCDLLVTNDTGPMHLAGAVGTPTLTLWGPSDPAEVRPLGGRDRRVVGPDLPCKPCFKNHCPRSGPGSVLADAHEECMRLIPVEQVTREARSVLEEGTS